MNYLKYWLSFHETNNYIETGGFGDKNWPQALMQRRFVIILAGMNLFFLIAYMAGVFALWTYTMVGILQLVGFKSILMATVSFFAALAFYLAMVLPLARAVKRVSVYLSFNLNLLSFDILGIPKAAQH